MPAQVMLPIQGSKPLYKSSTKLLSLASLPVALRRAASDGTLHAHTCYSSDKFTAHCAGAGVRISCCGSVLVTKRVRGHQHATNHQLEAQLKVCVGSAPPFSAACGMLRRARMSSCCSRSHNFSAHSAWQTHVWLSSIGKLCWIQQAHPSCTRRQSTCLPCQCALSCFAITALRALAGMFCTASGKVIKTHNAVHVLSCQCSQKLHKSTSKAAPGRCIVH